MKFSLPSLPTKLNELVLLDLAYVLVLFPLILMLKVPMILFSIIVLVLLYFKRTPASNGLILFVFILGIVAVYLSMYGAFSFRGLSRLKLFLELLIYVLLVVVAMQRLTREINFYLIISPFLFLVLSLFFYHGIVMLSYVVFEVFFLLWMILAHHMQGKLIESFRASMVMFMYSLPWVVMLFIFFPRISFEHANYGFKGETVQRMGHDGTMYLDSNALLVPSDRIVMEVGFDGEIPPADELYFRGSILYIDKKTHWEPMPNHIKRESKFFYPTQGEKVSYKVTLYPTQKKWIYLLDMPNATVDNASMDRDLVTTVEKKIVEPLRYFASSSLSNQYLEDTDEATLKASSFYTATQNPQSYAVAMKIKKDYNSSKQRAQALIHLFEKQSLTYTLKPDALDTNSSTDSFLFDKRRGYCVHFASSFATMARMVGIPSRIVTGYKSDKSQSLNNYLAVKEKDAHAWAELYIDKHWIRYESTSTASRIDIQSQVLSSNIQRKEKNPLFQKINLYLMYTKYKIETWILYYSHVRQLQLLDYAKKNPSFVFAFVISLLTLLIVSFMLISYFKRPIYSSEALRLIQPLLLSLEKKGYYRKKNESIHQFLLHYLQENPQHAAIQQVDKLYESILYGKNSSKEKEIQLKKAVKIARKENNY